MAELEARVTRAAEELLRHRAAVTLPEVLVGIGWLAPVHLDDWHHGRLADLQQLVPVRPDRVHQVWQTLQAWAQDRALERREVVPLARSRHRRELTYGPADGPQADPELERAIRVCWLPPELSERDAERELARRSTAPELVVISPLHRDWTCHRCGGTSPFLLMEGPGPICMSCADLDHLVYLHRGDATLTRRAKKASSLSAVVVRFSRARRRYERQGILVEEAALDAALQSRSGDDEAR